MAEYEPLEVVVGLPVTLAGTEGPAVAAVRAYVDALLDVLRARDLDVPVRLVDERLSTAAAAKGLRSAGRDTRSGRSVIDMEAAVIIVQDAVDAERSTGSRPAAWSGAQTSQRASTRTSDEDGPDEPARTGDYRGRRRVLLRRGPPRRRRTNPAVVVALLVVGALVFVVGFFAIRCVTGGEDFTGQGEGRVVVEVKKGEALRSIGSTLAAAGVVKSADAFTSAASAEPRAKAMSPGPAAIGSA